MRYWYQAENSSEWISESSSNANSWPDIELDYIRTESGNLAVTLFYPGWDARKTAILIVPGYFGSSRHGPYGLYSRLARHWAYDGFLTVTYDPLGSGESSPIHRSFETEVRSAVFMTQKILNSHDQVICVGHSMGAAIALLAASHFDGRAKTWCLAPLCKLEELAVSFFNRNQFREITRSGSTLRHGLRLELGMIEKASEAWMRLENKVSAVFIAGNDPYTKHQSSLNIPPQYQFVIQSADHNFSQNDNFSQIADITTNLLLEEE
jgi:pimeloyl-ACP methyl ester carboxylesterase